MATVIVHATITLDGFLAAPDGGVDWMFGRPSAPEDDSVVEQAMGRIGAVVGGGEQDRHHRGRRDPLWRHAEGTGLPHDPQSP